MLRLSVYVDPVTVKSRSTTFVSMELSQKSSLGNLIDLSVSATKSQKCYGETPPMIVVDDCGDYLEDTSIALEDYAFGQDAHLYIVKKIHDYFYTLNICGETPRKERINVPGNVPIVYLKRQLEKMTGIYRDEWKVCFAGKMLHEGLLFDYGCQKESQIHCIPRPRLETGG